LTLAQTNKLTKKMTIIIYGSSYWKSVVNLELLAAKGAIAQKDLKLFQFADTPEHAFELLKAGLTHHVDQIDTHEAHEDAVPNTPAPTAQDLLGPDINKTRR
jgi:predicted Rossmann-fold nucleotide-binding protein